MYEKVNPELNFVEREREVLKFWQEHHIFEKSIAMRTDGETYMFYDGPPTANGKPHIGHVETRVIKDMIPRYRTMKGFKVPRKAGWDTHGLPVELEVEKLLGLDGKEQIEQYGLEPFIAQCKKSVWKYKQMWEDFSGTVGFWADMQAPYVTYENDFIESEWWALKQIWEKGLLYKGFKIVPYCPRCGTPLSSHEVAQGYKDVKEHSAVVRFRMKDEDAHILVWTTTPWTLPSNAALCVNPDEQYVRVQMKQGGEVLYLAQALADEVLGADSYEVLDTFQGKQLEHRAYEPLFDFVSPEEQCWYITCDSYVTLTDGTGVVHLAPAFGADDANVGRRYGLPFVQLVDAQGCMTKETRWLAGIFCKEADKEILAFLKREGLLFAKPLIEHSYPHCWRCDTPLIYYAQNSWFVKMTAVKEQLIRNNDTVNWVPQSIGKGRFGDWLQNVQDWSISRNRYWGTPLNIWECGCGCCHAVGSIEELYRMAEHCPPNIELHRPYLDEVTLKCPECGGLMKRVPEVIDCWFDSGAMPFAQYHYPFENQELFEAQFPADFISEAVDQTRGWFYSLMAISTLLFDRAPFKNVIVMGHVQDEHGQKMSKSKGNAVDPFEALQTYGADAIRWYFYTAGAPWLPKRFSGRIVQEGQRKLMGTLWNTYAFFVLYANLDGFDAQACPMQCESLTVMDRWVLSKMNTMVKTVDTELEQYAIPEAARAIQEFVDDLSKWYVRRSRERFWASGMQQDKINAYQTLYLALTTICKAAAPMIPFMTEAMYQNLVRSHDKSAPESVHLCDFPRADECMIDLPLEESMELVRKIVTLGHAARNAASLKNRQPLAEMLVKTERALDSSFAQIIAEEMNVKKVTFTDDASAFADYIFKPQLKTLGPKYGKQLPEIRTALQQLNGVQAKQQLDAQGTLALQLSTGEVCLAPEDLLIEMTRNERYCAAEDAGVIAAIDTQLTDQLIDEGFIREIISKLQIMRKEAGFEVSDHIRVFASTNERLCALMQANAALIQDEVLADSLEMKTPQLHVKQWDINGEKLLLGVQRV